MEQQKGKLRVYGCGGMGINVASYFQDAGDEPNCAQVLPAYLDTSRSNLREDFAEDQVFVLDNVDGSGKVRKENHEEIANVVPQILLNIEPTEFNVVVFSASGGTGSVIGPLVMSELLKRGHTAVAVVVGSAESVITATNTLNTLKTLEAISKRNQLPVVMNYDHNDQDRSRVEVDKSLHLVVSTLAVLASKKNREMDSKDIANWVQFNKTTTVEPQIAHLEVYNDADWVKDVKDPISVASIYESDDMSVPEAVPEYHAAGYLPSPGGHFDQIHFVISIEGIPSIVNNTQEKLDKYTMQRDSRTKQASLLGDQDVATETGLVL